MSRFVYKYVFNQIGMIDKKRAEIEKLKARYVAVVASELRKKTERIAPTFTK